MKGRELTAAVAVLLIFIAIPVTSWLYEYRQRNRFGKEVRIITLTGTVEHGWVLGRLAGYNYWNGRFRSLKQLGKIYIKKGEKVVLRLESADVVHGFSLKGLGILDVGEIKPGRPKVVEFMADKPGLYEFNCNRTCGPKHEEMTGLFVVTEAR